MYYSVGTLNSIVDKQIAMSRNKFNNGDSFKLITYWCIISFKSFASLLDKIKQHHIVQNLMPGWKVKREIRYQTTKNVCQCITSSQFKLK